MLPRAVVATMAGISPAMMLFASTGMPCRDQYRRSA
jgi:hypothetical protein